MISKKKLIFVCLILFCFNTSFMVIVFLYGSRNKCIISINEDQYVASIIPDEFLSIGIDASELQSEGNINFSNEKFRSLVSALAPARLRIGGTMSDRLIFSEKDIPDINCEACHHKHSSVCEHVKIMCRKKFLPFFLLTGQKWVEINDFCKATNMKLLFVLNVLLRNEDGWMNQNAKDLLYFTKSHNFNVDWQLGNEPNSFPHTFNATIHPKTLANDFKKLRNLLKENGLNQSLIVGPDTTRPQKQRPECLKYMVEFLGNGSKYIDVRSWHQYYLNSRIAGLDDFWMPSTFDLLEEQIKTMKSHTNSYNNIPMWLTETSTSYGGGAPGLSNTYAGSPLWLDKLGLSAKYNITTVIRQSLVGGNYSLIDKELNPLPDWWISVLYKKLIGNKALHIDCHCSNKQRIYAHCTNKAYMKDTVAVTIFGVNLEKNIIRLLINGTAFPDNLSIDEYIISVPSNKRKSKIILLNGRPLEYGVSELKPRPAIKDHNHVKMPPYSIAFWVIKNANVSACQ